MVLPAALGKYRIEGSGVLLYLAQDRLLYLPTAEVAHGGAPYERLLAHGRTLVYYDQRGGGRGFLRHAEINISLALLGYFPHAIVCILGHLVEILE